MILLFQYFRQKKVKLNIMNLKSSADVKENILEIDWNNDCFVYFRLFWHVL